MKKKLFILLLPLLMVSQLFATHNRAGEITYEQISEFTYKVTLVTYTYTKSDADRDSLELHWGDETVTWIKRVEATLLVDDFKRNVYIGYHTYPGVGTYEIFMLDQNRNAGIGNIDGSVNIPFAIKTKLKINPQIGFNNAPILLTQPLDKAAIGRLFIHNPAAYDVDGDSLSYRLATCLGDNGEPIPHYRFPDASKQPIYINPVTGDLIWDTPQELGNYNVAFYIEEWRFGVKIGQVLRDMQITVVNSDNVPPKLNDLEEVCIVAGKQMILDVLAVDEDKDTIDLSAYGGPMELNNSPATFQVTNREKGESRGRFEWNTVCDHVRKAKYQVEFKAKDGNKSVSLVDFKETFITVVSPSPEIEYLEPTNNTITLNWLPMKCKTDKLVGYKIYRKIGSTKYTPENCQTGIPKSLGFDLIATIEDPSVVSYLDNDNGAGLKQGQMYCYRIVSVFEDGAEGYPSEEACEKLIRGVPIITNVDVKNTSTTKGEIWVAWVKPTEHDVTKYPGPYKYVVYRAEGMWGSNFVKVAEIDGIDNTEFLDENINTNDTAYNYKVEFFSGVELVSPPQTASSTFVRLKANNAMRVNIERSVPWIDTAYVIYRRAQDEADFRILDTIKTSNYDDLDVNYETDYCYYVKGLGYFTVEDVKTPVINNSQIACKKFLDVTPPCPPSVEVDSNCEEEVNYLTWEVGAEWCNDDVMGFEIYHGKTTNSELELIETINDPKAREWDHYTNGALAGCYEIRAFDYTGNKSDASVKACIDKCTKYVLPNAFSPDGDNINDFYHPIKEYYGVVKVDFKVFSRHGSLVFKTDNPELAWDGRHWLTGEIVSSGVYYYTCTVFEPRLTGLEDRHICGFIQIVARSNVSHD